MNLNEARENLELEFFIYWCYENQTISRFPQNVKNSMIDGYNSIIFIPGWNQSDLEQAQDRLNWI